MPPHPTFTYNPAAWGTTVADTGDGGTNVPATRASTGTYIDSGGALQTAAIDVARMDYASGTRMQLIEEARTNSIRNNTMVGAVAGTPGTLPTNWTATTVPAGLTRTISLNTINGISCIDLNYSGTTSSSSGFQFFNETATGIAGTQNQVFANSVWLQVIQDDAALTSLLLELWEYSSVPAFLSTGQNTDFYSTRTTFTRKTKIQTVGNASAAYVRPGIRTNTIGSGVAINVTFRIGMPQLELGAFATSVISTTTAAATRAADVCSTTSINWFNAAEGVLLAKGTATNASGTFDAAFSLSDGTGANLIYVGRNSTQARGFVITSSATEANPAISGWANEASETVVAGYKTNDFQLGLNGALAAQDTSVNLPVVTTAAVGSYASASQWNGGISYLACYPHRLPNAILQRLST